MPKSLFFAASAFLILTSCSGKATVGESCSDSSECADNTRCIPNGGMQLTNSGPACVDTDLLCSITCAKDTDCSSLGTGYICIDECGQGSCLKGTRS